MIRNLPEGTKAALRVRAARHHHSVEAEARAILTAGLLGEEVPMPVRWPPTVAMTSTSSPNVSA